MLACKKAGLNAIKCQSPLEVVNKIVEQDFTFAMCNYKTSYTYTPHGEQPTTTHAQKDLLDLTIFVVYDHRVNNQLEKIACSVVDDVIEESQHCFIQI